MNAILYLKEATKRFKDKTVFENINIQMESGKSYGFVGYNGCGKSVLFKTICGFSRLSSGSVFYQDKEIGKDVDFIWDAGIVIETPNFINDLSGYRNLKILAEIQHKINDEEIFNTLKTFDLYESKDKPVRKYSLGMKQKLRLCQALMEKPKVLILDEPTNGLDKASVSKLYSLLQDFVKNGGMLLMTSHNRADIDACCEKVYDFEADFQ